ncbi:hypothetical protein S7335_4762 [Synechococcus sp. PCC 7335]|uniref:hypothetical protein n=1 Tax=Synechococcus sp. (strain ATCC 29403 / PCC 7335) TaxID=91464 RepID=UPI00017EBBC9|nr:hypothetical protein [Synechococcus sp. PCC 7335]EDX87055.1 hypothetical protein S7335_4762 [Synechococcus sp. PCC 7335]
MSISELNHFMTYVIDGWALFSIGSISIGFISFVSRRIQEDIAAESLALSQKSEVEVIEGAEAKVETTVGSEAKAETEAIEAADAARLEEVAAVSEQLAKTKDTQPDGSVSVSI